MVALPFSQPPLQPQPGEILFCDSLVVGNTLSAYTATLALLQQGRRVCWAVPSDSNPDGMPCLDPQQPTAGVRLPSGAVPSIRTGQSRSQLQWVQRQQPRQGAAHKAATSPKTAATSSALALHSPSGDRPPLPPSPPGLILLAPVRPVRVLWSETPDTRRVYQVVFDHGTTAALCRVHAGLTIDATANGTLSHLLGPGIKTSTASSPPPYAPETRDHHWSWRDQREPWCEDALGGRVCRRNGLGRRLWRPISLRELLIDGVSGWMCLGAIAPSRAHGSPQATEASWRLGEVAGHVAHIHHHTGQPLRTLALEPQWRGILQQHLARVGVPLLPFIDVTPADPDFEAIQVMAAVGIVRTMGRRSLDFLPQTPVTLAVAVTALGRVQGWSSPVSKNGTDPPQLPAGLRSHWAREALAAAIASHQLPLSPSQWESPNRVITRQELAQWVRSLLPLEVPLPPLTEDQAPARRRDLSRLLYRLWCSQQPSLATHAKPVQ